MKITYNKIDIEVYIAQVVFSLFPAINILNKMHTFEIEIGIFKFWLSIVYKKSNGPKEKATKPYNRQGR